MKYLVFDVESAGLHGDGFAVGYAIVDDESGMTLESDWRTAGIGSVSCDSGNLMWLLENLPLEVTKPQNAMSMEGLREWFVFIVDAHSDCLMASDCAYPVEVNFLRACGMNPYPLHEIATALLMAGRDPTGNYDRHPDELPKHHPMHDARQSARVLLECISSVRGYPYAAQWAPIDGGVKIAGQLSGINPWP